MRFILATGLGAGLFVLVSLIEGVFLTLLPFRAPAPPPGVSPQVLLASMFWAALVLSGGMVAVAHGLAGSFRARFLALGGFIYLTVGLNTALEGAFSSHMLDGAMPYVLAQALLPCSALALLIARLVKAPASDSNPCHPGIGRFAMAWLAFPLCYWTFGMIIAPLVRPIYAAGIAGLKIPDAGTLIGLQLVRSAFFLLASWLLIRLWCGGRWSLFLGLGTAHTVAVGLFGLIQVTWFPMRLRVVHSLEITADSFAYAALLVLFLCGRFWKIKSSITLQNA